MLSRFAAAHKSQILFLLYWSSYPKTVTVVRCGTFFAIGGRFHVNIFIGINMPIMNQKAILVEQKETIQSS